MRTYELSLAREIFPQVRTAYIHSHWINPYVCWLKAIWVNHDTTSARRTEFVRHHLFSKLVGAEMVVARIEDDVLSFWINHKIAIDAANRTVAAVDFLSR
jgi:hypothetical protein